jgi:hypothetical protein
MESQHKYDIPFCEENINGGKVSTKENILIAMPLRLHENSSVVRAFQADPHTCTSISSPGDSVTASGDALTLADRSRIMSSYGVIATPHVFSGSATAADGRWLKRYVMGSSWCGWGVNFRVTFLR